MTVLYCNCEPSTSCLLAQGLAGWQLGTGSLPRDEHTDLLLFVRLSSVTHF